jgi:hypothetical protein
MHAASVTAQAKWWILMANGSPFQTRFFFQISMRSPLVPTCHESTSVMLFVPALGTTR